MITKNIYKYCQSSQRSTCKNKNCVEEQQKNKYCEYEKDLK